MIDGMMELRFNVRIAELVHELKKDEYKDAFSAICDKADALKDACTGNGAGLNRGQLVDRLMSETLKKLPEFEPCHTGQADLRAFGEEYSWKTLTNGSGVIALSWSKNGDEGERTTSFERDVIILNLVSERWYKRNVEQPIIERGIYVCDKDFANECVTLGENNKTDALVSKADLLKLLMHSLDNGWFVPLEKKNTYEYVGIDACLKLTSDCNSRDAVH
jgi:hypothetical protein